MDLTKRQVDLIVEWAASEPSILEVRLFGSRSKGSSQPDSDVDLAVTIAPFSRGHRYNSPQDIYLAMAPYWKDELSALLGIQADIERYDKTGAPTVWSFVQEANHLIYARPPGTTP